MSAEPSRLAYRAVLDVSVCGERADAGEVFHLPGGEEVDPRVALLLATRIIERAPEHDRDPVAPRSRR